MKKVIEEVIFKGQFPEHRGIDQDIVVNLPDHTKELYLKTKDEKTKIGKVFMEGGKFRITPCWVRGLNKDFEIIALIERPMTENELLKEEIESLKKRINQLEQAQSSKILEDLMKKPLKQPYPEVFPWSPVQPSPLQPYRPQKGWWDDIQITFGGSPLTFNNETGEWIHDTKDCT